MVNYALFASVFVIATCGLVYELVAGTMASYLLGDSVFQFSTVIGVYLFSMGIGSYLSRFITKNLIQRFIEIEILIGLVGGFSAAGLILAYSFDLSFRLALYLSVLAIGTFVGLEIPLLIRILKGQIEFRNLVSQVLTLDYIGALAASLLFPLVLVPKLGLLRSAFIFGIANVAVGWLAIRIFRQMIPSTQLLRGFAASAVLLLTGGFVFSSHIYSYAEESLYADEIILAKSSRYQRIILTRWKDDLRLYLNSNLQFSSIDEYRYHESLVHPGLAACEYPRDVLVLGGGDGLAVREILKDPRVKNVRLVDLDPAMTDLFTGNEALVELNQGALKDSRVSIVNEDAFKWLDQNHEKFDFVAVDFPDPSNYSVGKLYTSAFYKLLKHHLRPNGIIAVQSTSPMFARKSFWCIEETIRSSGFHTTPYHVYVPSFGEWGFVMGSLKPFKANDQFPKGLKFLNARIYPSLFEFPDDMGPLEEKPNKLDDQRLVSLYDEEWMQITK